jgi:benzoyl-CoA reductase/2-hydroxyglutaryl-CoA dehydratase subunit BcrC/BadD/HgdB
MSKCCGGQNGGEKKPAKCLAGGQSTGPFAWFDEMIDHCYDYAKAAKQSGKPIVGILCEYSPRELIVAAGGVPVCLCGGSAKTIPAAEEHLPANLCPLIKSTYGYHVTGTNPFLEMADLIVGETTCDGKKKMYELMSETRPMYVLELPQKSASGEGLEYWHRQLERFRTFLTRRYGCKLTDDDLREAIRLMNRERSLRRQLAELMKSDDPPMTGRQLLGCKSSIWGMAEAFEQYERVLNSLGSSCGKSPKSAASCNGNEKVRVLMTGVPMVHGAERVLDIVESCGGLVVSLENCTGVKPLLDDVDENAADPLRAIAEKYYSIPCSVMTPNDRRIDFLRKLAADYRPECVVDLIWQACLTYDVESHRVKRFVEEELKLPYLRIETDYSPSDSARINIRVEALLEMVRTRR